jgi:transposase
MSSVPVAGCDPHLDSITVAVIGPWGDAAEMVTVPNTEVGWAEVVATCHRRGVVRVGIEGASGYGRRCAQTLTGAGITVLEVPTRLTARTRRVDGTGKTDPGDARTIGRAVGRGEGHRWRHSPALETLRVLTARRDHLVGAQTADINQLRALLGEIDPAHAATLGRLRSRRQFQTLAAYHTDGDQHRVTVGELVAAIAAGCGVRHDEITRLTRRIRDVLPPAGWALIDEFVGCDTIVAALVLSQIAGTDGFATDAKMAAWAGTAPLDASSGRQQRHRLNRGGNRQVNRAIHTIVVTQLGKGGPAADYIHRRITEGKTRKEAIRAAKRHITRRIWKTLHHHGLT